HPARVRLELAVAGHGEELGARLVQRRHAGVSATAEVDGPQAERQAEQVAAKGLGDELVDLVAVLPGDAADDGAGPLRVGRAAGLEGERVQEGLDHADLLAVAV